ncbi:MAG: anti-sigma factor [Burkholderiales bacterium]|nr:MAG: anti-sigma factor [Burkholderiales bacterium]
MTTKCPTTEAMSAYADGELATEQRTAIDKHLASCARCRSWLAALRAAQQEFRSLADEPLGFDLSQVVRGRIEALPRFAAAGRAGSRSGWRWLVPAGVGAAVSVSLGLALGLALTVPTALPRPVGGALEVFAPGPPGGLCAGAGSCRVLSGEAIR